MRIKASFAIAALVCSGPSLADDYPRRPITFVVPSAPGGSLDALVRGLAQEMHKRMGQPIIVENKPGAGGLVGAQAVARAKPDGYTVLVTYSAPIANAPFLNAKMPYAVHRHFAYCT